MNKDSQQQQTYSSPFRTVAEIQEIVKFVRLSLYNRGLLCGDKAIRQELSRMRVAPIPSLSAINRILKRHGLTHRRTGFY